MSIFNSVKAFHPRRNTFNLTHERKFSCPMGKMIPILCEEVIPGDRWQVSTDMMLRMAPMISPIMHRVNVYTHFFYVPYRLCWDNWKQFITGGERPMSSGGDIYGLYNGHVPSFSTSGSWSGRPNSGGFSNEQRRDYLGPGSLMDYLGMNPTVDMTVTNWFQNYDRTVPYSVLPLRAYQMIYNEYYRDEVLQDPVAFSTGDNITDTDEMIRLLTLRTRNWEKDYFTTATPWTQKGNPVNVISQVTATPGQMTHTAGSHTHDVPAGTTWMSGVHNHDISKDGPLLFDPSGGSDGKQSAAFYKQGTNPQPLYRDGVGGDPNAYYNSGLKTENNGNHSHGTSANQTHGSGLHQHTLDDMQATGSVSVNDIRAAFQVQRWLERNMRAGSRYIESILAHFGVRSSDARLQRPEFLGGGKSPVIISEVLQTANTDSGDTGGGRPTGDLAGHGFSAAGNHAFRRFFEEHGVVIGIMSVMPRTAYMSTNRRHFIHGTTSTDNAVPQGSAMTGSRFDFFWPEFAHLGEQAIYNWEISPLQEGQSSVTPHNPQTFGYSPRYNEYRFIPSTCHGMFKTTMRHWHMARQNNPSQYFILNGYFVTANPTDRIFAITNGPDADQHCWVQVLNKIKAVRPIPKFGAGGLIDH